MRREINQEKDYQKKGKLLRVIALLEGGRLLKKYHLSFSSPSMNINYFKNSNECH